MIPWRFFKNTWVNLLSSPSIRYDLHIYLLIVNNKMKLDIQHQETYSRGELLLRSFFGWIYILVPHYFVMIFYGLGSMVVGFIAFWAILFTGKYPRGMFDYQVKFQRYMIRVAARFLNLVDGYPAFGLNAVDPMVTYEVAYPESLSRGLLLLKMFFGFFYVFIPHYFVLYFRMLWTYVLVLVAWFVVLFTGKYPAGMHAFNVGTLRWAYRVSLYMSNMTDVYPPFSGKE
jgi:hypothetical protein